MKPYRIPLYVCTLLLLSCGGVGSQDTCSNFTLYTYNVTQYDLEVLDANQDNLPWNPAIENIYVPGEDLAYNRILLSLDTSVELISGRTNFFPHVRFSLFPSAIACSPPPEEPNETIASIEITSSEDYDASHPAGTSLNDIFNLAYIASELYMFSNFTGLMNINEYLLQEDLAVRRMLQLSIGSPPDTENSHTFSIQIVFTNGKIFNLSTPEIELSN